MKKTTVFGVFLAFIISLVSFVISVIIINDISLEYAIPSSIGEFVFFFAITIHQKSIGKSLLDASKTCSLLIIICIVVIAGMPFIFNLNLLTAYIIIISIVFSLLPGLFLGYIYGRIIFD